MREVWKTTKNMSRIRQIKSKGVSVKIEKTG